MKQKLNNFFQNWWLIIIIWFLSCVTLLLTLNFDNKYFDNFAFPFFGFGVLIILVSGIFQLFNKSWLKGILSFLFFGISIFGFIFYCVILFLKVQTEPDPFGKNHTIPKNIQIEKPIDLNESEKRPTEITNAHKEKTDFQLYNSFQPGLYEYDFWTNKIENGTIYLKAYEITKNTPLSEDRLPERSSINIENKSDSIKKFSTINHFTIYEGDWGDYYSARFEVWFKPRNGGKERKLFEKNYIIEGWMR